MSKNPEDKFSTSDTYNGTRTDKYSWSQTIKELDVKIPVPPEVRKGRDVIVDIQSGHLKVSVASTKECIVDGNLTSPIIKSDSYWNLTPGEAIYVWLHKAQEKWWTALVEGEKPIDMKDIEPVRPMEDLPEVEQQKIQELMWNHEQKQKGLPTSEELKMQEVLKKAWDAEGSPFKGTPYDPSKIQLTPNSAGPGMPPPGT